PELPGPDERAVLRRDLGLDDGDVVVVFVGQLEDRKDPMTAILAAERARAAGAAIVLLLAGEGPLAESVAAREGAAVRYLGYRRDVPHLLGAADIFVAPS